MSTAIPARNIQFKRGYDNPNGNDGSTRILSVQDEAHNDAVALRKLLLGRSCGVSPG